MLIFWFIYRAWSPLRKINSNDSNSTPLPLSNIVESNYFYLYTITKRSIYNECFWPKSFFRFSRNIPCKIYIRRCWNMLINNQIFQNQENSNNYLFNNYKMDVKLIKKQLVYNNNTLSKLKYYIYMMSILIV